MKDTNLDKVINARLLELANTAGKKIMEDAVRACPVDDGQLRNSIDFSVSENTNEIIVEIVASAPHARFMEYGRAPGPVPIAAIERWAKRHNINPYAVQKSLMKKGIKVGTVENPLKTKGGTYRPYLRPAVYKGKRFIEKIAPQILKG